MEKCAANRLAEAHRLHDLHTLPAAGDNQKYGIYDHLKLIVSRRLEATELVDSTRAAPGQRSTPSGKRTQEEPYRNQILNTPSIGSIDRIDVFRIPPRPDLVHASVELELHHLAPLSSAPTVKAGIGFIGLWISQAVLCIAAARGKGHQE